MTTAVDYINYIIKIYCFIRHKTFFDNTVYLLKWFKMFYLSNRWSVDCIDNNIFGASIILFADVSIIQNGLGVL